MKKHERLAQIISSLAALPLCNCPKNTHANIIKSFEKVESQFPVKERMNVGAWDAFNAAKCNKRSIWFFKYKHHVLLIGDNGAFEIRSFAGRVYTSKLFTNNILFAKNSLPEIFVKTGADGRDVWQSN